MTVPIPAKLPFNTGRLGHVAGAARTGRSGTEGGNLRRFAVGSLSSWNSWSGPSSDRCVGSNPGASRRHAPQPLRCAELQTYPPFPFPRSAANRRRYIQLDIIEP